MLPYTAGEHRRSPPPRGAFASSLSPSAAPFPAADPAGNGRDLPTAPSVYAAAAAGDWGNASWIEPPVSYMAPVAASTASAPGYRGEPPHSTPYGIYSRIHFSDFPGLHPLVSESSNLLSEKHPGTCQENSEALSNGAGQSFFHQQQDSGVSKFLDHSGAEDSGPYPPRQDLNQYPFGSPYDKYMTQLSSCSTDTQPHILSSRYVSPSEMTKRTGPVLNATTGESSFSSSSYMNPCRINLDYFDCVWNEQKDTGYQTTDKQYGKWSNSLDDMAAVGNYPLNPCVENRAEHLGNERPMEESSELKLDLGNFNSRFSSSEIGFLQPREFSSELLEVNNTSVDSPCWKGTPATYLPSFSVIENKDAPHTATGTVGYNSRYQSQKAPDLKFGYPARFPKCQEASGSENDLSKMFKLPMRFENSNNHVLPPIRVHDDVGHASYLLNIQHARTQECNAPREDSKNVITSSQQESSGLVSKLKLSDQHSGSHTGNVTEVISKKTSSPIATSSRLHVDNLTSGSAHGNHSAAVEKEESTQKREGPSQYYPDAEGNVLNVSSDSSSSTRAIFLKLMHNLSVVLLSTCKDGSMFQENEEEILQSVIQNLTAASSKRSKIVQKTDDGLRNSSQMKFKNINSVHEHSASASDLEFKTAISQVLTALPDDKMLDDTKVSEASIYKNLWIEAEASACKLKYELQLARMNLAAMKGHNNTLKIPYSSEGSKGSDSSMTSSSKQQNLGEESTQRQGGDSGNRQSPIVHRSTVYGVDDDVFARLKVLQSRTDNVCSFGELDCGGQQEASKKPYGVEDAVMARLQVLKSRPDNVTFLSQESNPDASTNRADDAVMDRLQVLNSRPDNVAFLCQESNPDASTNRADDAVMDRLQVLKSRPDNVTFLSQESTPDASTNRADDAVLDRLRILESRPNNMTFLAQESSKHEVDAGTNREDVVDDAVMARLRILKSRPDNVTSTCGVSMEHEELKRDGVEVLSIGLTVNKSSRSADVASPKRCEATPEETTNNGEVQGEDGLGGNQVWPQAAGNSNVCAEVSAPVHQHGSSPSEWEHVLKENFFHPGK